MRVCNIVTWLMLIRMMHAEENVDPYGRLSDSEQTLFYTTKEKLERQLQIYFKE